jgi:hypothetical protein
MTKFHLLGSTQRLLLKKQLNCHKKVAYLQDFQLDPDFPAEIKGLNGKVRTNLLDHLGPDFRLGREHLKCHSIKNKFDKIN